MDNNLYKYFFSVEEFYEYCKANNVELNFHIIDFENKTGRRLTDDKHPIVIYNLGTVNNIFINSSYHKEHFNEFKDLFKYEILNAKDMIWHKTYDSIYVDDELIDVISKSKKLS